MANSVNNYSGISATLNVAADTVIKSTFGRLVSVNVVTAGSAAGAVHDCKATGDAAASNKIATIPNTVGTYVLDWPCIVGITYKVGTGQVVAIKFT